MSQDENAQGRFVNQTAKDDPIDNVIIEGFDSLENAMKYVQAGFHNPTGKTYGIDLPRGEGRPVPQNGWVVFWHTTPGADKVLLSILFCHKEFTFNLQSWGAQFFASRDRID